MNNIVILSHYEDNMVNMSADNLSVLQTSVEITGASRGSQFLQNSTYTPTKQQNQNLGALDCISNLSLGILNSALENVADFNFVIIPHGFDVRKDDKLFSKGAGLATRLG